MTPDDSWERNDIYEEVVFPGFGGGYIYDRKKK